MDARKGNDMDQDHTGRGILGQKSKAAAFPEGRADAGRAASFAAEKHWKARALPVCWMRNALHKK